MMWLFVVFLLTAVITAFYTARMVMLTFFGSTRATPTAWSPRR